MLLFSDKRRFNRLLLAVELFLVAALLSVAVDIGLTLRALNDAARRQQARALFVARMEEGDVQPAAHRQAAEPAPLPAVRSPGSSTGSGSDAALPPPADNAAAARAHRLQIPAIGVDSLIYEGWDEAALRRGVGLRPGSPGPGEAGNLLLSAHNDIHGAIFRRLDHLKPGDALYISTENVLYTYVVRDVLVVSPESIWVTLPTGEATATLISCYPYLLDSQRIVVFADFAG